MYVMGYVVDDVLFGRVCRWSEVMTDVIEAEGAVALLC